MNIRPHKVDEEDAYTINYIQIGQLENKSSGKVPVHNDWVTKITFVPQLRTGTWVIYTPAHYIQLSRRQLTKTHPLP